MREEIRNLEKLSRPLDPGPEDRLEVRSKVIDYCERFLNNIPNPHDVALNESKGLLDSPIEEGDAKIDKLILLLEKNVHSSGLNPASAGHLGYIPGGGLYSAALGDYLAAVFNRYAGLHSTGPGAVVMENMLIRWMAQMVGYPENAAGNLTTGGSLAHLIAIVTARDAKVISGTEVSRSVVYVSEHGHHSIDKALRIAGLGTIHVRRIPVDERYRMRVDELEEQIELDYKRGFNPFLAVASAGTTNVGAVDPLEKIGAICRKNQLWYHVDAAYGGFFLLTAAGREKLRGMELSDSVIMDPHKGLFLPYGLGVVLVKDQEGLKESFYHEKASYLQDDKADPTEPSPADLSPELTKHFRGLRLWLPLKLHGVAPFRASLEEKLLLAEYFYNQIKQCGFEVSSEPPDLSVVTYRYVPTDMANDLAAQNKFNEDLNEAVVNDGRIFISSTRLNGKFTLRFACLSFRTHLDTIDELIKILNDKVAELLKKQ